MESVFQTRLYSIICVASLFLLLIIWFHSGKDHMILNERHYDTLRAVDNLDAIEFRVGFKYKKTNVVVSGIKAFPKRIMKISATDHLTRDELISERTLHGLTLSPVLLIQNDPKASAHIWNKLGALNVITGYNHDAYAIDLPGFGHTKLHGRISSSLDFYKGILDHWHWPSVILVAMGSSVDHILHLIMDDLKEFELRVEAVILIVEDANMINHHKAFKLFKQTKLIFCRNLNDKSEASKSILTEITALQRNVEEEMASHEEDEYIHLHKPRIIDFHSDGKGLGGEQIKFIISTSLEDIDLEF